MTELRYQHKSHVGAAVIARLWGFRHENPACVEMLKAAIKAEKSRRDVSRYRAAMKGNDAA